MCRSGCHRPDDLAIYRKVYAYDPVLKEPHPRTADQRRRCVADRRIEKRAGALGHLVRFVLHKRAPHRNPQHPVGKPPLKLAHELGLGADCLGRRAVGDQKDLSRRLSG